MPKVLTDPRKCVRCGKPFFRSNGNTDAKYCSRLCACRDRNTREHQTKAGKIGAMYNIKRRGTGRPDVYVKENGQHQHRKIAEKILGRKLRKKEIIHHINGNKHDNRPENLAITTREEHPRIHLSREYKKRIQPIRPPGGGS